ncbi:hypothetical protein BD311DRAFT_762467, partial [Dichomitus squalens]
LRSICPVESLCTRIRSIYLIRLYPLDFYSSCLSAPSACVLFPFSPLLFSLATCVLFAFRCDYPFPCPDVLLLAFLFAFALSGMSLSVVHIHRVAPTPFPTFVTSSVSHPCICISRSSLSSPPRLRLLRNSSRSIHCPIRHRIVLYTCPAHIDSSPSSSYAYA